MYKHKLLLLLAWVLVVNAYAQTKQIYITVNNPSSFPNGAIGGSGTVTNNSFLNSIFSSNGVLDFYPAYPAAYRNDAPSGCIPLKSVYSVAVPAVNSISLISSLNSCASCNVSDVYMAPEYKPIYQPNDYNTLLSTDVNCNWHLDKINAKQAWDISKGSSSVKIAIIDLGFDLNHPDFQGKVLYSELSYYTNPVHGTYVASIAAGKTDDGVGVSSIGFNSSLLFYFGSGTGNDILRAALDGADVINISMASNESSPSEQLAINQAYQLGAFIVAGAGNAMLDKSFPENPNVLMYPASYDHVFSVTSVYSDDAHRLQGNPLGDINMDCHQHNNKVDLCAPGFHITHAEVGNSYSFGDGTSFASPIVAGTVALMKAANSCITNDEIESILKQSSDPIYNIADNNVYLGKLGAGRLNAFNAVNMAKNWSGSLVVTNSMTINQPKDYKTILIKNNGHLTISNTTIQMLKEGSITIETGGRLTINGSIIKAGPVSATNPCIGLTPYKWKGIVVEGNPNQEQNYNQQGVVHISNSTIQDAMNAVSAVAKLPNGSINWSKTGGGVIVGTNTIFKNNARHLEFISYHRPIINGSEPNNKSSFTSCQFLVDDGQILTAGNLVMITLYDVKGVKFSGCKFENTYNNYNNLKGKGILAVDASIIIENNKNIAAGGRSTFKNLEYGIDAAFSPYSGKLLFLNNGDFVSNKYGVCLKEGLSSSIYRNSFDERNTSFSYSKPIGLQAINSSGFIVSENSFFENVPTTGGNMINSNYKFGSEIYNSDKYSSSSTPLIGGNYTINSHSNIMYGTQTNGKNGMLNITCNAYANYYTAIDMDQSHGNNVPCPNFGSCNNDRVDRNNTFYTYPTAWNFLDILGGAAKSYVIDDTKPLRPRATNAQPIAVTGCKDGGEKVSAQICDLLFEAEPSPNDGVFDQWNPNAKINEYRLLKQSIPGYPHEGVSIPDKLYNSYIKLAEIRTDIIYKYNHLLLFDAEQREQNYFEKYIDFLTEDGTKESKKIIVGAYYSYGLYNNAMATLHEVTGDDENTLAFKTYYNLLLQLHADSLSVFEMNAQQEMIMRNLAGGNTASSSSAQGIITLVYGDSFLREPRTTEFENTTQAGVEQNASLNYTLTVYPNPMSKSSSTAFDVDYAITVAYQSASLQLRNHFGEVVYQHALSNAPSGSGHQTIPTQNITEGLYIAQLIVDGVIVSYKLVNLLY